MTATAPASTTPVEFDTVKLLTSYEQVDKGYKWLVELYTSIKARNDTVKVLVNRAETMAASSYDYLSNTEAVTGAVKRVAESTMVRRADQMTAKTLNVAVEKATPSAKYIYSTGEAVVEKVVEVKDSVASNYKWVTVDVPASARKHVADLRTNADQLPQLARQTAANGHELITSSLASISDKAMQWTQDYHPAVQRLVQWPLTLTNLLMNTAANLAHSVFSPNFSPITIEMSEHELQMRLLPEQVESEKPHKTSSGKNKEAKSRRNQHQESTNMEQ